MTTREPMEFGAGSAGGEPLRASTAQCAAAVGNKLREHYRSVLSDDVPLDLLELAEAVDRRWIAHQASPSASRI